MIGYRVCFKKIGVAELETFNVSDPKDNEVQVKVEKSLISAGTEKAYLSGSDNTAKKFPSVPGYSSVGYVTKIGKAVTDFKVGDRVCVEYGGHANYNVKAASSVVKIPDEVSFEEAVFFRLASFPLLAIRRAQLEIGESVVVIGLGMLGLFAVQLAKIGGGLPVIAVGNRDIRKNLAKQFGADYVFSPDEPDLTKKIYDITLQETKVKGANVVVETSGSESGLLQALECTSKRARVLVNGCNRVMTQPIDFYQLVHLRGVNIIGAHDKTRMPYNSTAGNWTAKRDYITLLGLMKDKRLKTEPILSEIVSPEKAGETYERLLNDREFPLGVVFDWTKV